MLVLSRKRDESITLKDENGNVVTVTVVRIDANKVRLGIEAGEKTTILRSELVEEKTATAVA